VTPVSDLHLALARARLRASYSQDDVGAALGVSRAMVSYWEAGSRTPNDRQSGALAQLYGVQLIDLIEGSDPEPTGIDLASMLMRADENVSVETATGIREFVQFLDRYAELSRLVGSPVSGLSQSPFAFNPRFTQKDDIRRKAEEVRGYLGLGTGPVPDLDPICEMLGITVYRSSLGADLTTAPSGAFLNHPDIGFSILVNLDMTPGRRRFTVAHEIAHALFHSNETNSVVSRGTGTRENLADTFAGEFLMPSEGVRRFIEEAGIPPRIEEAVDIVHIQRYFHVSWPTALVRLRQMNAVTADTFLELRRSINPVSLALSLGYTTHPEEHTQDPQRWRLQRFPRPFLRMLREAVLRDLMSPPTAASFAGLALPEIVQVLGQTTDPGEESVELSREFREYEATGVV
jgi:Zn-dependent peptidase ImmA (M78 family)/transcriptional regulator with XRE-family HTH domain